MNRPKQEVWYQWREYIEPEEDCIFDHTCLLIPWRDPSLYEYAFDFIFNTPEEAFQALKDWNVDPEEYKDWVLVEETLKPVEICMECGRKKKFFMHNCPANIDNPEIFGCPYCDDQCSDCREE